MSINIDWSEIDDFAKSYYSLPEEDRDTYIENIYNSLEDCDKYNFLKEVELLPYAWNTFLRCEQRIFDKQKEDWTILLVCAGRRFGKTISGSCWIRDNIYNNTVDPKTDILVFGANYKKCKELAFDGDSSLTKVFPPCHAPSINSDNHIKFHNGNKAYIRTAENADHARGSSSALIWMDEIVEYPKNELMALFNNALASLSKTPGKMLITSTPKSYDVYGLFFKDLYDRSFDPANKVKIIKGRSIENVKNVVGLEDRIKYFEGTATEKEEFNAEFLFQSIEMMFTENNIRENIINTEEDFPFYAIGLDVAVTTSKKSDETGIILIGKRKDGICVVLEDKTSALTPDKMANTVLDLWVKYRSMPNILIEKNQGGSFISSALLSCADKRNLNQSMLASKIKEFHATDSKSSRAYEPSISLKQNKIKFCNINNRLEPLIRQLCRFTGFDNRNAADDRVDGFTSAINFLLHKKQSYASPGQFSF